MSDKLNMDKQIREKLEDFSFAPPPHVFNNVQAQLAAKRKRVRMAYIGFVTAAAVVVFAFIAGWNLNNKRMATQPALVEQEMILSPKKQEPETLGNNLGNTRIAKAETVEPKQSIALETALETEIEKNTTASVVNELGIENTFVTSFERVSFELMESLEAFWVNENKVALAQPKTIAEPILSINNNDAALIA